MKTFANKIGMRQGGEQLEPYIVESWKLRPFHIVKTTLAYAFESLTTTKKQT